MNISGLNRVNSILIFIMLVLFGLYFGASVLIPLTFAIFLAALILPLALFLETKWKMSKPASSFWCTLVIFIGLGALLFLLVHQLGIVLKELIDTRDVIVNFLKDLQQSIVGKTGIFESQDVDVFPADFTSVLSTIREELTSFLTNISDILLKLLVVHVYLFLLLLNRDKLVEFLLMYTSEGKKDQTLKIIQKTRKVSYHYFWGRLKVMSLLAVMYFITFSIYELPFTGLLVLFGTLITVIPFIGPFISGLLPILVMFIFGDTALEIISFAVIVMIIQLIESYVLEPIIIGEEVQQSPLFVILAIFTGGLLWGGAGLILFVPIFAILKIIFDNSEPLKPVGYLMGYERHGAKEGILDKLKRKLSR
ncbi:AI-2E family transporter [Salegentibacter sediminis]|uniref:AI-2E family transporter n=1 Tax=Salegentibacter sediminis TaxID=1930251 RepID=UPI0009BE8873|nr:AI-2E family transporter [Salegentibacter sediminis]